MTKRRRWAVAGIVFALVVAGGEVGLYRANHMRGTTYMNVPWQLRGEQAPVTGTAAVQTTCATQNASCRALAASVPDVPTTDSIARVALRVDDLPWCYTPLFKLGSLSYEAEVEITSRTGEHRKTLGFRGDVDAWSIGLGSCDAVRQFLLVLAGRDMRQQLRMGLARGTELMWKCSDGKLRSDSRAGDPCTLPSL